ncbi:hypothetical protein KUA23_27885 [Pseudomonas pergaminensis]|uniref:Uncharacterized protein n=1 Tax=Pseudomonas pergaminensis TaxID=2853159 RepID=A0ABD7TGN8_9PSED|nr:hypothetical protein [Pseudomonas pergaminensis]USW00778.1 hypothetical protein KUA23_27885 [Pseudomonas pergaminensis]
MALIIAQPGSNIFNYAKPVLHVPTPPPPPQQGYIQLLQGCHLCVVKDGTVIDGKYKSADQQAKTFVITDSEGVDQTINTITSKVNVYAYAGSNVTVYEGPNFHYGNATVHVGYGGTAAIYERNLKFDTTLPLKAIHV